MKDRLRKEVIGMNKKNGHSVGVEKATFYCNYLHTCAYYLCNPSPQTSQSLGFPTFGSAEIFRMSDLKSQISSRTDGWTVTLGAIRLLKKTIGNT